MALTLKQSVKGLKIGDYFWCKYVATSGVVGTFSDMATKSDSDVASSTLPTTSTTTPNGYFKFIVVDIKNGKTICIADRQLHNNISWDSINNDGYVFGRQVKIDNNNESNLKYTLKLMSGGTAVADTNNDYDKYIINSTLNGNIVAGDNNIWNWVSGQASWTSTTLPSGNTVRIFRGSSALNSFSNALTSNTASGYTYRPMLIIEKMYINKSFISFNGDYKKLVTTTTITGYTNSSTVATPVMTGATTPSGRAFHSTSYSGGGYDSWKLFNQTDETEGWCTLSGTVIGFAGYIFDTAKTISRYTIRSCSTNLGQNPKNWTFEGSNDTTNGTDGTWVILDTQSNQSTNVTYTDFNYTISNPSSFKAYRVNITSNNGYGSYTGFNELKLYERIANTSTRNDLQTVTSILPTKAQFLSDGMSDLSVFDRKLTTIPTVDIGTSVTLGSGKQFANKLNLKKYFDIRNINIK